MGRLRTSQELDEYFALQREKRKRKEEALQRKEEALQRKKEALEHKKKHILDNTKEQEKKALKRLEKRIYRSQRTIIIYNSRYVDRFQADDEVYKTREELMEAERRGEGSIRWDVFDKLIEETKQQLK